LAIGNCANLPRHLPCEPGVIHPSSAVSHSTPACESVCNALCFPGCRCCVLVPSPPFLQVPPAAGAGNAVGVAVASAQVAAAHMPPDTATLKTATPEDGSVILRSGMLTLCPHAATSSCCRVSRTLLAQTTNGSLTGRAGRHNTGRTRVAEFMVTVPRWVAADWHTDTVSVCTRSMASHPALLSPATIHIHRCRL
jgi:hypothetical protein